MIAVHPRFPPGFVPTLPDALMLDPDEKELFRSILFRTRLRYRSDEINTMENLKLADNAKNGLVTIPFPSLIHMKSVQTDEYWEIKRCDLYRVLTAGIGTDDRWESIIDKLVKYGTDSGCKYTKMIGTILKARQCLYNCEIAAASEEIDDALCKMFKDSDAEIADQCNITRDEGIKYYQELYIMKYLLDSLKGKIMINQQPKWKDMVNYSDPIQISAPKVDYYMKHWEHFSGIDRVLTMTLTNNESDLAFIYAELTLDHPGETIYNISQRNRRWLQALDDIFGLPQTEARNHPGMILELIDEKDWLLMENIAERKDCNYCLVSSKKLYPCHRCWKTYYCCQKHQVLDWVNYHGSRCVAEEPVCQFVYCVFVCTR